MGSKLLRLKQVAEITTLGRSTIWLWIKQGRFPKPKKLSAGITVWQESEILEYILETNTTEDK